MAANARAKHEVVPGSDRIVRSVIKKSKHKAGTPIGGSPEHNQELRTQLAKERLEVSSKLTVQQKLDNARKKEKNGISCVKEIAKYERMLELQEKKPEKKEQTVYQKAVEKVATREKQQKKVAHDKQRAKEIGN